jgi:hypothetical protein
VWNVRLVPESAQRARRAQVSAPTEGGLAGQASS